MLGSKPLDYGLYYGLDYGLDFRLDWTVSSALNFECMLDCPMSRWPMAGIDMCAAFSKTGLSARSYSPSALLIGKEL